MLKTYAKYLLIVSSLAAILVYIVILGYATHNAAEGRVYWCKDFESKEDAQKAFDTGKENYKGMDADGDHEVCESHPFKIKSKLKEIQVK
jgi:hypothetical protein